MPLEYNVDSNLLTDPPSHYPRVAPISTLDLDDIAGLINLHNPTVPAGTAKETILLFIEEIKTQIIEGNWVKLDSFCSFSSSIIGGSLESPGDTLPGTAKTQLRFKPSAPFLEEVRNASSFERIGYTNKTPQVVGTKDSNLNVNNIFSSGNPLSIDGSNIGYDQFASDEGIFLQIDGASSPVKQINVARNKPSNIIVIPSVSPSSQGSVATKVVSRTRYTPNGQLKEGVLSKDIRSLNSMTVLSPQVIFKPTGSSSSITVLTGASPVEALFTTKITPQGDVYLYGQLILNGVIQDASPLVLVDADGDFTVVLDISGLPEGYIFNVSDYQSFFDYVDSQGRFIQEHVNISL